MSVFSPVEMHPIVYGSLKQSEELTLLLGYKTGSDTGTANAYVISIPGITVYTEGMTISFVPQASSTSLCTVKINSLATKIIVGTASGTIQAGNRVHLKYISSPGHFELVTGVYTAWPPEFAVFPIVSYRELDKQGTFYTDDTETKREYYYVVDVWGKSPTYAIEAAVEKAMYNVGFTLQSAPDLFEADTRIYHKPMTFKTKR